MIKTLIYDVDGTLIDSEPIHMAAWDTVLAEYNHSLAKDFPDFLTTMAGKKPVVIAEEIVATLSLPIEPAVFVERKMVIFEEEARTHITPMPGAVESVNMFYDQGYRLAIGTSLDRSYLDTILTQLGIGDKFEVIVTGDQITHGKPNPETYDTVIQKLGINPHEAVVFEDAPNGIAAAKAAGAWCVAIGSAEGSDATAASFYEVDDTFLQNLLLK